MKFAKLFNLENDNQVLVVKDYDNEKEKDIVTVSSYFEVAMITLTFSFNDEASQLKHFDSFNTEKAKEFRNKIESDFSNLML